MASGLQVSPVTLSLQPSQTADGLWLSNVGDGALYAQIRVYHWTQEDGGQDLTPSRGILVSPPILQIAPGDRQLVRVIRVGAPPIGPDAVEDAYRLSIDELPVDGQGQRHGLQFILHYSLPIFIEPAGRRLLAPSLRWNLVRDGTTMALQISNSGSGHAQVARVSFVDGAGHSGSVTAGLLGYVLPGATVRFALRQSAGSFVGSVTFQAMINGSRTTQHLSLADSSH